MFFLSQGLFIDDENHFVLLIDTSKLSTNEQEKSNYNRLKLSNLEKNVTPMKTQIPRISIQRQANCLIDDIDFDDVENTNSIKQNNNYHKGDIPMTYDKVSMFMSLFSSFFFRFCIS